MAGFPPRFLPLMAIDGTIVDTSVPLQKHSRHESKWPGSRHGLSCTKLWRRLRLAKVCNHDNLAQHMKSKFKENLDKFKLTVESSTLPVVIQLNMAVRERVLSVHSSVRFLDHAFADQSLGGHGLRCD